MPTLTKRTHKHFQLDSSKIKRAQRALHAKTETAVDPWAETTGTVTKYRSMKLR